MSTAIRTSRSHRPGRKPHPAGSKAFWVALLVVMALAGGAIVFWEQGSDLINERSAKEHFPPEQYESLKDVIVTTSLAFGINPSDINWAETTQDEPSEFVGDMQEVRISALYPKMLFHLQLLENLAATNYLIEDCIETSDGLSLEFNLINANKSRFRFRLISDKGTLPRASHLVIIIDRIQSKRRDVQQGLSGLGVMYAFVLSPGAAGFKEMRNAIQAGGQQILYEVPFEKMKFIRTMDDAARVVGLKGIGNLDQAIYVLELLAGDFKYLYRRESTQFIDRELMEGLGRSGFVIFAETKIDDTDKEAFLRAGGKIVSSLHRTQGESVERLYSTLLEFHRTMLFSDNWGAIIIDADADATEGLQKAAKQLSRLNCKITPISQLALRTG